jgi:hypothetical protein
MPTTCTDDDEGRIAVGHAVCVSGWDGVFGRPKVKRATAANLTGPNARTVLGVCRTAIGGVVTVNVAGEVADVSITGLSTGANTARLVVTKFDNNDPLSQAELRHIDDMPPVPERFVVGSSDQNGTLTIQPRHYSEETAFPHVFNIKAYGALPSNQDGTGTITDCTPALLAAIQAATTPNTGTNQPGVVYIPPAPLGREWYLAGAATDMLPTKCIEISRTVHIIGDGPGGQRGGSRIKLGPLCSGFRFTGQTYSSDGGDSSGTIVEGLTIYQTPLSRLGANAIQIGWQHAHRYSVGDKIRPVRWQNLYFECVKAGTSGGPAPSILDCTRFASVALQGGAINRWAPGTSYTVGTKVYPNVACHKTFICTSAGKTINRTDAETTPNTGKYDGLGEPDWFSDPVNPATSVRTTIIEPIDENGNPGPQWAPFDTDYEPLWEEERLGDVCHAKSYQANHSYWYGSQVFPTGRFDVLFVATTPNPRVPQPSGAAEPALFATAHVGDTIPDGSGSLVWVCIPPLGLVVDNEVIWAARFAGAFLIEAPYITIKRPYIATDVDGSLNCPTAAILISSGVTTGAFAMNADFTRILGPGVINGCGVCIYAHGPDSNAGVIKDIVFNGEQYGVYGATGEHCVYDRSFLGNYYQGCVFNGQSGWGFAALSQAGTASLTDCYTEGGGLRRSPAYGALSIRGGTIGFNFFRMSRNWPSAILSAGGTCQFADRSNYVVSRAYSTLDPRIQISSFLQDSPNRILFFRAENIINPGTGDDQDGYGWQWNAFAAGGYPGWWSWVYGNSNIVYSASSSGASIGPGQLWFLRGFLIGQTDQHYHFSDHDNAADVSFVQNAGMRQGDIVDRADLANAAVGRFYHQVNINPNNGAQYGFDWTPNTPYTLNTIVVPTQLKQTLNHRAFKCTTAGTSNLLGAEPAWPDTLGATVTDNSVVWTAIDGAWIAVASEIQSGIARSIDLSGGSMTLQLQDDYVTVTLTAAGSTVFLPDGPFEGKWCSIKNRSGATISIDGNGHNIDGSTPYSLNNFGVVRVRYNATRAEWEIR